MKYSDFISLDSNFMPVFDLTAEQPNYWKKFIPVNSFFNLLDNFIEALTSNDSQRSKSFIIQGSYGVGKSHASSVIKHLLCDDFNNIQDFLERIGDSQLKSKLENLRKTKKAFSITLKGVSGIYDNKTFSLVLQKAVKRFFPDLTVKTDFETYKNFISENNLNINWNDFIKKTRLTSFVNNVNALLAKLEEGDNDILNILQEELSRVQIVLPMVNIVEWIKEVSRYMLEKRIADYFIIFWDEVTPILDRAEPTIINQIQNIAELTRTEKVFLYLISHRTAFKNEDIGRMLDRFNVVEYYMETITSYHLISATFNKNEAFGDIQNSLTATVENVIQKVLTNNDSQDRLARKDLENIIPIHPYSAYLLTFIARNLGSTERSIFSFIFDDQKGFNKFIQDNPEITGNKFLTADILWDYFLNDFYLMNDDKTSPSLERYSIYKAFIEPLGKNYLKVFKVILLLNILYRYIGAEENSLVTPSESNIKSIFQGEIPEDEVLQILHTISEKQYITKTVDNLYLVTASVLSHREVEEEKIRLENEYKDIIKIFSEDNKNKIRDIISNQVLREVDAKFYPALSSGLLRSRLRKDFTEGPNINVAVFICRNDAELQNVRDGIKEIGREEEFKNLVFLVIKNILDDNTFNRFIDNLARSNVAYRHNYREDGENYKKNAERIIEGWVESILSSEVEWYLRTDNNRITLNVFGKFLNDELSKRIFTCGFENLNQCTINKSIWERKNAPTSAEIFLFANNRQYIEENTTRGISRYLRPIIQDENEEYIVDTNLNFKNDVSKNHPIVIIANKINEVVNNCIINGVFNLGEVLGFLAKPPFGFFPSQIHYAVMGFLMRDYVGKLYEAGTGTAITGKIMSDKIKLLFNIFEKGNYENRLNVRLGTPEESRLQDVLKDIFAVDNIVNSLTDIKWKVRDFLKDKYPLWLLYHSDLLKENDLLKKSIDCIDRFIKSTDSEINRDFINELLNCIESTSIDLKNLFSKNEEYYKELFYAYICDVLREANVNSDITDEICLDVEKYVQSNLQETKWNWDENKVRNLILQFWIRITQKEPPPIEKLPVEPVPPTPQTVNVIEKIKKTDGKKVKKVLRKIIDEVDDDKIKEIVISIIQMNIFEKERIEKLLEENID